MDTQQIIDLEKKYLLQTYNRPNFVISGGEGVWLIDSEGNRWLDGGSGIAVNALGHNHPALRAAITRAMSAPIHLSNLYHNEPMTILAQKLCESSFADRIFFANSGSEANEGAFKFARKYAREILNRTDKTGIVAFSGSFHGRSMGAVAATATEKYRAPFEPVMPDVTFAEYNNIASARAAITEQTCAVIVEPIQGEGGVTPAHVDFLAAIRQRCDETDALLIFDEVQCGLGRSGILWAHQSAQITPDIMTIAKPIAGGFPMGAILMTQAVASAIHPGDHGSTFAGGMFVSTVANALFDIIAQADFLTEVRAKGDYLRQKLDALQSDYPHIEAIRGAGMMWGIVTTIPAADVVASAQKHGLLILSAGANVVRLLPPLIISRDEIDLLIEKLTSAFKDCTL